MSRRIGEKFRIGEDIEIMILDICRSRVRIGISAPGRIPIIRDEELFTREENKIAARSVATDDVAHISERLRSTAERFARERDGNPTISTTTDS